ncbi:kinase-like domain-containing protein [Gigaspora rosea]|uniref:Kinase-like domain-containing protein n=1 Tax=Gigaspora rosea TaxID=44941 RepID=A0A397VW74_9GLOM|nr:kinase-like domain-containing protein [Gigaspora rosea]
MTNVSEEWLEEAVPYFEFEQFTSGVRIGTGYFGNACYRNLQWKKRGIYRRTPSQYVELYKHCLATDPDIRPEAISILETLNRLIANFELAQCKQSNENFTVNKSLSITKSMGSNIQNEESITENWLEKAISDKHINYIEFNKLYKHHCGRRYRLWKDVELTVALKVDTSIDEKIIKDFIDEFKLLQRVSYHPNIITFYGVTKDNNGNYNMILDYANEGTLREYLKTNFTLLQWTDKLRIAKEIALGLLFLHDKDIIHRDLHSKNIIIHQRQAKITDFGLAKQMNEMSMTSNSIVHGMTAYIEPQCFIKSRYKRDKRSDVYSFGQILWEISSGRPPFSSFNLEIYSCFQKAIIVIHVFQGNREEPIEGTPSIYRTLQKMLG